ncbi:hypothetical protein ACFDR9_003688 [Janthinobacterium sp. CG_23.3]|uniref:hypothetical protein n=1 Tax=Janthinobacterium sp. CG_23.3 TaxID=3349634 RepID=UPI0038D38D63
MQLNAQRALVAALMAIAAAGNACAVTMIVSEPSAQTAFFDGALAPAQSADDAAPAMALAQQVAADPFQPAPAAALAAAQANEMAEEPSPYEMLLLGAGLMMLVGRSGKKSAPWAPSTVA